MGTLIYGPDSTGFPFDDRLLEHLRVVMLAKLRRGESFAFSWMHGGDLGGGRSTIWVHPAYSLEFKFSGGRIPSINRTWVDALMATAYTPNGLRIVPEPADKIEVTPDEELARADSVRSPQGAR